MHILHWMRLFPVALATDMFIVDDGVEHDNEEKERIGAIINWFGAVNATTVTANSDNENAVSNFI